MSPALERLLLHPLVLLALALWALNDHVLKAAWHSSFTGKLSDVAALVAGPVILAALSALLGVGQRRPAASVAIWSAVLAFVMIAINLSPLAADLYCRGLGALQWPFRCLLAWELRPLVAVDLTIDPSDAWTAPAALIPALLASRQRVPEGTDRDPRQAVSRSR